jgi:hypothetical protein
MYRNRPYVWSNEVWKYKTTGLVGGITVKLINEFSLFYSSFLMHIKTDEKTNYETNFNKYIYPITEPGRDNGIMAVFILPHFSAH